MERKEVIPMAVLTYMHVHWLLITQLQKKELKLLPPHQLNPNGGSLFPIDDFGFFADDFSNRTVFNFTL